VAFNIQSEDRGRIKQIEAPGAPASLSSKFLLPAWLDELTKPRDYSMIPWFFRKNISMKSVGVKVLVVI
jgi:hypothetical protein